MKEWVGVYPADEVVAQEKYDTVRLYIEKCAVSDTNSWVAFTHLDGANQARSNDSSRYAQYRAWLISVLYLNKVQPEYFCACMGSIGNTYQKTLELLALWNYLRQNHPECWGSGLDKAYSQDSISAIGQGYDPTHLPSLNSLGLGFLNSGVASTATFAPFLISFTSSPNPFTLGAKLNFTLSRMTYVTIEVYDLLGNKVFGNSGRSYEAGGYEINLDGSTLPSGTLYARISTGFGEVKTVKLVHEK